MQFFCFKILKYLNIRGHFYEKTRNEHNKNWKLPSVFYLIYSRRINIRSSLFRINSFYLFQSLNFGMTNFWVCFVWNVTHQPTNPTQPTITTTIDQNGNIFYYKTNQGETKSSLNNKIYFLVVLFSSLPFCLNSRFTLMLLSCQFLKCIFVLCALVLLRVWLYFDGGWFIWNEYILYYKVSGAKYIERQDKREKIKLDCHTFNQQWMFVRITDHIINISLFKHKVSVVFKSA